VIFVLMVGVCCVRKDGIGSLHAVLFAVGILSLSGDCWIAVFAVFCWQVIGNAEVCVLGPIG